MKKLHVLTRMIPILFAGWLFTGCSTVDPVTGGKVNNMYSLDEEVVMGRSALQANTAEMRKAKVPINRDKKRVKQLNEMMNRIAAVSHLPKLPYNVTLFHNKVVNAAAAPGGSMMVFEGLYDPKTGMVKDENELAAVMAHEIAHVNCRHVTEKMTRVMPLAVGTEIAAQVLIHQNAGDWAKGLRLVSAAGAALWIPAYSRQHEAEADRVGMMYMAKAGYDPRAAPRIWKRVADKKGKQDSSSIFSTHPADIDRYRALVVQLPEALEAYKQAVGSYPKGYTP